MRESPIFVKTQDLLVWLMERTAGFPKSQRFVMAKRVQDAILDFQVALVFAAKNREPLKKLREADVHLEVLRKHIRTCVDLNLLSVRQYEFAALHLVEIGKLLGGWMHSLQPGRRAAKQAVGSETEQ